MWSEEEIKLRIPSLEHDLSSFRAQRQQAWNDYQRFDELVSSTERFLAHSRNALGAAQRGIDSHSGRSAILDDRIGALERRILELRSHPAVDERAARGAADAAEKFSILRERVITKLLNVSYGF